MSLRLLVWFYYTFPKEEVSHFFLKLAVRLPLKHNNFYISVAKDLSFKRKFSEMASLSLSIAVISFGMGYVVRTFLGV